MTTVTSAKNKGRCFERDAEASLQQIYPHCHMTHEVGYIMEYDLQSVPDKIAVECKRLKGISWNQAKGYFNKLKLRSPVGYTCYLLFQSNYQPCLVMYHNANKQCVVAEFEHYFGVEFIRHTPIKVNKKEVQQ